MIKKDTGTLDRNQIMSLVHKFLHKKYGHHGLNAWDQLKYKELVLKIIKCENVDLDIDSISPQQFNHLQDMMTDFNMLRTINIHSGRCSPMVLEKFWFQIKKLEKLHKIDQADYFTFLKTNLWRQIRN